MPYLQCLCLLTREPGVHLLQLHLPVLHHQLVGQVQQVGRLARVQQRVQPHTLQVPGRGSKGSSKAGDTTSNTEHLIHWEPNMLLQQQRPPFVMVVTLSGNLKCTPQCTTLPCTTYACPLRSPAEAA